SRGSNSAKASPKRTPSTSCTATRSATAATCSPSAARRATSTSARTAARAGTPSPTTSRRSTASVSAEHSPSRLDPDFLGVHAADSYTGGPLVPVAHRLDGRTRDTEERLTRARGGDARAAEALFEGVAERLATFVR